MTTWINSCCYTAINGERANIGMITTDNSIYIDGPVGSAMIHIDTGTITVCQVTGIQKTITAVIINSNNICAAGCTIPGN